MLIYREQVFNRVGEYLSLKDLLRLATISKEANYVVRKYIRLSYLPKNSPQTCQLQQLKREYNRECYSFDLTTHLNTRLDYPKAVSALWCQGTTTLIKSYSNTFCLGEKKLFRKYKGVVMDGSSSAYGWVGGVLYRLKAGVEEESREFAGEIEQVYCSAPHCLVVVWVKECSEVHSMEDMKSKGVVRVNNLRGVALGRTQCYLLLEQTVHVLELESMGVSKYEGLQGQRIARVVGGKFHWVAAERSKAVMVGWSNEEVVRWAEQEGFNDYAKILLQEKVTGKVMVEMSKKYMEDVLGITNFKVQQKMVVKIREMNEEETEDYVLYGWGSNANGQLLPHIKEKEYKNPVRINLPQGYRVLLCQETYTVIGSKHNTMVSDRRDWVVVSNRKVYSLGVNKKEIIYCCTVVKEKVAQMLSAEVESEKKDKRRSAKNIINKIMWDENLKKEDFSVGYLDRYDGVLEESFEKFTLSDIKEHCIQYFKKGKITVWSKKDKIDIL